jgi:hypothetical protein
MYPEVVLLAESGSTDPRVVIGDFRLGLGCETNL